VERYFRFERSVSSVLEQVIAQLCGGSVGAAGISRSGFARRRGRISAAAEWTHPGGDRTGRLSLAAN